MSPTASRVVAVLFVFAGALAAERLQAAPAVPTNEIQRERWTKRQQTPIPGSASNALIGAVDSSTFDVSSDAEQVSLSLGGEYLVFRKDSYQRIDDDTSIWSGRSKREQDATYLYVAKNGDDVSLKLVEGDLEYDVVKDSSGDYELRTTNLKNAAAEEYLADSDRRVVSDTSQEVVSDASQELDTNSSTTFSVAAPLEITVNLAYTRAALTQYPSATALKNAFVIGLGRVNDTLRNSNLNVRVKLGRVIFVKNYRQNSTLQLVRQDVEDGRVPGLPVPAGKNKTVLVVDVYGKFSGTAMLGGPYIVINQHAISTLLLAHEMGHSFGAIHLKAHQFANGRYTAMVQDGSLGREPIYSNPKARWFGQRAGSIKHFNAKRMCDEFFRLGPRCWITPQ